MVVVIEHSLSKAGGTCLKIQFHIAQRSFQIGTVKHKMRGSGELYRNGNGVAVTYRTRPSSGKPMLAAIKMAAVSNLTDSRRWRKLVIR